MLVGSETWLDLCALIAIGYKSDDTDFFFVLLYATPHLGLYHGRAGIQFAHYTLCLSIIFSQVPRFHSPILTLLPVVRRGVPLAPRGSL